MRTLPGPLATSSQLIATTLVCLVDIVCLNGTSIYMTSSDRDVTYLDNVYKASYGCNLSQVQTVLGTSAESVSISALIDPAGITAAMIESGSMDNATMRVLIADFALEPVVAVVFFEGFVAQVTYEDKLTALVQGNPYLSLALTIASDVFSSNCRADFGDATCKYDITSKMQTHAILSVVSQQQFTYEELSVEAEDHYWVAGVIQFVDGANKGFSIEIQDSYATVGDPSGTIVLKAYLPYPVQVGDTINMWPGCDKTCTMCSTRWDNIVNFQGEPFSVAPWVTTASGDTTGTTVPPTGLYLYGTKFATTLGPFDGPDASPPQPRMPAWGPYPDQWNFSGHGATGPGQEYGPGTGVVGGQPIGDAFVPAFYVSTKLTVGQYIAFNAQGGVVQGGNIDYSSEVQLTPAQAATVKLAYPDAPYDG